MSIRMIPTRSDNSLAALHAINSCFLRAGARAYFSLKKRIENDMHSFRYMGDFLINESRFLRKYADYSLYRRFVPEPQSQQSPYTLMISAESHTWHNVDDSLESYLGYTLGELENDWVVAYHPDSYEETDEKLTSILRELHLGTSTYEETVVHYQTKIGYSVWSQLTFSLVKDWKGAPEYFMTVLRDVTLLTWRRILYAELEALIELVDLAGLFDESVLAIDGLLRHFDGEDVDQQTIDQIKVLLNTQL